MAFRYLNLVFVLSIFLFGCGKSSESGLEIDAAAHQSEVEEWYQNRVTSLKKENGWLNLIGLEWLKEGSNSFGTDSTASVRLNTDKFQGMLGDFTLEQGKVFFSPSVAGIMADSASIEGKTLIFDEEQKLNANLQYQTLRWTIIKRADAYGVRIRDLESPAVVDFQGIDRYPVNLEWRVKAKFVPYVPAKNIMITNVLGQTTPNPSPGYLEFEKAGKTFKIDALDADDELYLIIADQTSGAETYGAGRYLYVKKPVEGDEVIIDFNKAYNPPCVFTPYATCPLPPKQNILELAIEAGEKTYGEH
jgi:uncharacterized protein